MMENIDMKERIKTVKKDNKLLAALKWTGIFFLLILGLFYIEFLVSGKDESITEHLFRNNIEKYVGEIEFLKSKSELSSKGAYFRVEGYPHSIYHYSSNDIFAYHDKVNSIKINELYYKEIKEVLESYFRSQEAVFHFTCNISYSDLNEKKARYS